MSVTRTNPYVPSFQEIEYNLKQMETTLQGADAHNLDIGFLQIFRHDIENLASTSEKQDPALHLSRKIEHVAAQMYSVNPNQFSKNFDRTFDVDLISQRQDFTDLAVQYANDETLSKGLQQIGEQYDVIRIAGDGHCLFRAYALGLVSSSLEKFIQELTEASKKPCFSNKAACFATALQALDALHKKELTTEEIFQNKEKSNALVECLRNLATNNVVEKNRLRRGQGDLHVWLHEYGCANIQEYCTKLNAMEQHSRSYGGQIEINSLKEIFKTNLYIVSAESVGRGQQKVESREHKKEKDHFVLLFRRNHYDVLIPKQQQIEEVEELEESEQQQQGPQITEIS